MAKASSFDDACMICSSKYNRIRPSLCQCKHCSQSFCFDCMKDHNDELQQNIVELSNQYNELTQLIKTKKKYITDETIQSKQQLSDWLRKYIENLTVEKAKIDIDIEKEEKKAQEFVWDIASELQVFSDDIEVFTKTSIFQSAHMKELLDKLKKLIQRLDPLAVSREYDLPSAMPKYIFKFEYSSKVTNDNTQQWSMDSEKQDQKESSTTDQRNIDEPWRSKIESTDTDDSDVSFSDENYFCNREKFESTSYTVHCMASNGIDIMYSTIEDPQQERIAYCYLDDKDSNYRQADPSRIWYQSHIVDMIWWNSIVKFVCATENGIYTVEYLDGKFRILNVINNRWAQVRVAANTDHIWINATEKIMVYNVNFQMVRLINFSIPRSLTRASFCLTDNIVAFALTRRVENTRDILDIEFYDFDMKREKRVRLGVSEPSCMIRTDGNDRFYVVMGQQRFYIVSTNGNKHAINLGKQAGCLTVVNSCNVVLTKSRSDLELVRC